MNRWLCHSYADWTVDLSFKVSKATVCRHALDVQAGHITPGQAHQDGALLDCAHKGSRLHVEDHMVLPLPFP